MQAFARLDVSLWSDALLGVSLQAHRYSLHHREYVAEGFQRVEKDS